MRKIFSLLLFLITFTLFNSNSGAMPPPPRCEEYTYSNCPSYGCEKTCIPSACSGNICTADCDGPGSCHLPIAKSCIKLGERFKFYTQNQFCCDGLTRAPGKDTKNIIPGYSTCIKIDGYCDTRYENEYNSPKDCKKEETKIPKNCISWYDGCNVCSLVNGKALYCTKRACFAYNTPKCLKYKEDVDENKRYINYIYKTTLKRLPSRTEMQYYEKFINYDSKKYIENGIYDGLLKKILFDALDGHIFISQNNVIYKNLSKEDFIKNLYQIGLGRKITDYELKNWKKLLEENKYLSKKDIFDYFFKSKEFEKYMQYNNYHFTSYSNEYLNIKIGEFGKLNIKFFDLLPLTLNIECDYGLTAIYDGKGDKVCVKIGDGKCNDYEDQYNSIDCKIGCKNYSIPSGTRAIYNYKNCIIGYDKIDVIKSQNGNYECIDYPIYSYIFKINKQINHYLPKGFQSMDCKHTGIIECGRNGVYLGNGNREKCCLGLTKVKVKGTNNFLKCVKIDNYCSETEKDTYSSDCQKTENILELTEELKIRMNNVIKKFMVKLNNSRLSNKQKIEKIQSIISKINTLILTKRKYKNIFEYLNKKLEEEKVFLLIGM